MLHTLIKKVLELICPANEFPEYKSPLPHIYIYPDLGFIRNDKRGFVK